MEFNILNDTNCPPTYLLSLGKCLYFCCEQDLFNTKNFFDLKVPGEINLSDHYLITLPFVVKNDNIYNRT